MSRFYQICIDFVNQLTTLLRWSNFLSAMGKDHLEFKDIIEEISHHIKPLIESAENQ